MAIIKITHVNHLVRKPIN